MKNYFDNCKTVEEAKKLYRELAMANHPDHGGNSETMKKINADYEKFLDIILETAFTASSEKSQDYDINPFADILKKIIHLNIRIEIIGFWIYAFDSYDIKDILREYGFWFSGKYKAWIYNGQKKIHIKSKETLNSIRSKHGSKEIRNKENQKEIA